MIGAHAVAVVVTALLLTHADGLLSCLRNAADALLPRVVMVPTPAGPPVLASPNWHGDHRPYPGPLIRGRPRRGPPRKR